MNKIIVLSPEELQRLITDAVAKAIASLKEQMQAPAVTPRWLTREQAAELLEGSRAFIDRLVRDGRLRPYYPYTDRPGTIRFKYEDVTALRNAGVRGRKRKQHVGA